MPTTDLYIDFPNNARHGDYISYRITVDGSLIAYSGDSGSTIVTKTFKSHEPLNSRNFSLTTTNNQFLSGTTIGTGFDVDGPYKIVPAIVSGQLKYYVGGIFNQYNGNTGLKGLCRLNADGTFDSSFTPPSITTNFIYDLAVQTDGKIIVVGYFGENNTGSNSFNSILRLNTNGSIDNKFGAGVRISTGANGVVRAVRIQPDGKIVIGGYFDRHYTTFAGGTGTFTNAYSIMRFNTNGTKDTSWTPQVTGISDVQGVFDIDLNSSGEVIIAGEFTNVNSLTRQNLAKLNGTTGAVAVFGNVYDGRINAIQVRSDDNIYIGGKFNFIGAAQRRRLALIDNANGQCLTNFISDCNADVEALTLASADSLYVGGKFTNIDGIDVQSIAKVDASGNTDPSFSTIGYTESVNPNGATVRTIAASGSTMAVGGTFRVYENGPVIEDANTVKIDNTFLQNTAINLADNLVLYNSNPKLDYGLDFASDTVTVEVTYSGSVFFDSIQDEPNYVEINLENPDFGIVPIIIKSRSPHFLRASTSTGTTSVDFDVKVWNGNFVDDEPASVTLPFVKQKIYPTQNILFIDVAPLCRSFIQVDLDKFLETTNPSVVLDSGLKDSAWMKLDITQYAGTASTTTSSFKYLVLDGYGETQQGVNPLPPKVLMTNSEVDIWRQGNNKVYFNTSGLQRITYVGNNEGTLGQIVFDFPSDNNFEYIKQLSVIVYDNSDYVDYTFYYAGDVTITKRFYYIEECLYTPIELYFKNAQGVLQSMTFFKKSSRNLTVESSTYERSILTPEATYDPRRHVEKIYALNSKEEFMLNTGYVRESMNNVIRELKHSDEVYMNDSGVIKPVLVATDDFTPLTRLNDKLINYTIKVKLAQNVINNIL